MSPEPQSSEFKCQECGACCAYKDPKWVEVNDQDAIHIPKEMLQDGDVFDLAMTMGSGRCCALKGDIGKQVECIIYEFRPRICKSVMPGSALCLFMRKYHHLAAE